MAVHDTVMKRGYILIELLLSLFLSLSVFSLANQLLVQLLNISVNEYQDYEAFSLQFQQLMNHASNVIIDIDTLNCTLYGQDFEISLHNRRLVKQPGYEILLENIEGVHFTDNIDYWHINLLRNNEEVLVEIKK